MLRYRLKKYILGAFLVGLGIGIVLSRHFSLGYFTAVIALGAGIWTAVR